VADVVLPVRELAGRLTEILRNRGSIRRYSGDEPLQDESEAAVLPRVLELLHRRTGHDFAKYKRPTVLRRLIRRMQLNNQSRIPDYLAYLENNVEEIHALFNDLLITVTTFFRDPPAWQALQDHVIEPLLAQAVPDEPLRCWVPGCATGEEAYSLAMLFSEVLEQRGSRQELTVFASDVDERALAIAREGLYTKAIAADLSEERIKRWFRPTDDHYQISPKLRERVVFATHSVQRDPPFSRLHLISCRNLLIYLDRELQEQVMQIFRYALRDDGYLFLGTSETANPELFLPVAKQERIYRAARALTRGRKPALPDLRAGLPRVMLSREIERPRRDREAAGEAHRVSLEQNSPPSLLVDESWNIVHLSETAGRFLQPRGGPASLLVTDAIRPELRGEIVIALRHAFESGQQWLSEFVAVSLNGGRRRVAVLVQPRPSAGENPGQALIVFLEAGVFAEAPGAVDDTARSRDREQVLLEKLQQAEMHIEHLHADHNSAEEDLRATNEELQSLNEEYRSTTEELETSKEELQSINEELQTVNFELKTKLEEVSRAHDDLENLMTATDIATLFVDRQLCIKRFTPQLSEIFNVKSYDLGRPIGDITHSLAYDQLESDSKRVLEDLAGIEREIDGPQGRTFIARLRPYRTATNRIDGVVITLVDVTRIKRAEAVLRESEERFRALVAASAQMVWTMDANGQGNEDSPSWRAFTGQTYEQWKGSGWLDAVHPDDRPNIQKQWGRTIETASDLEAEYRIHHAPSGTYRWISVRAVPLRHQDGAVRGWVGMSIDITERKEAENSLRESDERKDEFLAMLGHELRNPLAAIRNSVEAAVAMNRGRSAGADAGAGAGADAGMADRVLAVIDRQSRHMTRLVNDLLDVTRITQNKLELDRQPVELRPAVEHVIAGVRATAQSKGLELVIDLADDMVVHADPERLAQILDNLLGNAINFTERDGRISIVARRQNDEALVCVTDTGDGMDPDQIAALFQPYRQAVGGRPTGGLGLGLTLVKRLVEMHGGTVSAHSDGLGHGSEFRVTLPLSHGQAQRPAELDAPARSHRILVVDDEADVADMFAALLEELGQQVRVAYDGETALQIARKQRPQMAFVDLAMPSMSGREVAKRLRQQFPPQELRLVALTGHGTASTQDGEFQHHLMKPAEMETVVTLLNALGADPRPGN
jgi:two-component system, chemotaxis family, CheB/CheR fusion protein